MRVKISKPKIKEETWESVLELIAKIIGENMKEKVGRVIVVGVVAAGAQAVTAPEVKEPIKVIPPPPIMAKGRIAVAPTVTAIAKP